MDVIISYGCGILFIIVGIFVLQQFGKVLTNDKHLFSENLLIGYVCYIFMQFILGFITQILRLNFYVYVVLMIIMVCFLLYFTFVYHKKYLYLVDYKVKIVRHLSSYWLIYLLAVVLVLFSALNITYMWLGNHQDDGLYLLKVALLPELGNTYDVNYATGFQETLALSRLINTFELDYAFWSKMLFIHPSVFCKIIMAFFNYVLVLNGFNLIIQKIRNDQSNKASILLCSILLFSINPETMVNHGIMNQQDAWHFNTAMWYGSAIVRCLGPVLLLYPFIEDIKITVSKVCWFGLTAIALVSRASQALPLVYLCIMGIIIIYLCFNKKENKWKRYLMLLFILFVLMILPNASDSLHYESSVLFSQYMSTPLFIFAMLIVILVPIIMRKKEMIYISLLFIVMFVIAYIPTLNSAFVHLSTVSFVIGRTLTMFSFYFILLAGIYLGILLEHILHSKLACVLLYASFGCLCSGIYMISLQTNFGLLNTLDRLIYNPNMIPVSTEELSKKLQKIAENINVPIYAIGPSWVNIKGFSHVLGTTLRIDAKDVYSISAIHRFPNMTESSVFKDFDDAKQNEFEMFRAEPTVAENKEIMKNLLKKYPINLIYDVSRETSDVLQKEFGYHLINTVQGEDRSYYILIDDILFNKYYNIKE